MSGNQQGGLKARDKNLQKDPDFYHKLGAKGGKASNTGGFWHTKYVKDNVAAVSAAGQRGGTISRRNK